MCFRASKCFQWHSCPSLGRFVVKVALLHLVVLGAMPTLCVVPWCHGLGWPCCCCWNPDSVEISPVDTESEFLDGLL